MMVELSFYRCLVMSAQLVEENLGEAEDLITDKQIAELIL
jgi:hypothetical protein